MSYAAAPTPEFRAQSGWEAARSLGAFLGVDTGRAADLLASETAGPEIRARRADPAVCRRSLERKYIDATLLP